MRNQARAVILGTGQPLPRPSKGVDVMFPHRLHTLRDPYRRSRLFTLLTALFVFLWPLLGAAPILALWLVHLVLLLRWTPYRGLRVFYGALSVLAALLLAWSLAAPLLLR